MKKENKHKPGKKISENDASSTMAVIGIRPIPEPFLIHVIDPRNIVVGQITANQASLAEVITDLQNQYGIEYRIDVYAILAISVE